MVKTGRLDGVVKTNKCSAFNDLLIRMRIKVGLICKKKTSYSELVERYQIQLRAFDTLGWLWNVVAALALDLWSWLSRKKRCLLQASDAPSNYFALGLAPFNYFASLSSGKRQPLLSGWLTFRHSVGEHQESRGFVTSSFKTSYSEGRDILCSKDGSSYYV